MTPSSMVELGSPMPDFRLPDPSGMEHSRQTLRGERGTLVVFMCNHCPFVQHVAEALAQLGRELPGQGISMVGINANDADAYPQDAPPAMAQEVERRNYLFPYLFDASQEVARAFGATCTPDFFLYDAGDSLVYRGQLDGSRPGRGVPNGEDLRRAVKALVLGEGPLTKQQPSIGCNIKWR